MSTSNQQGGASSGARWAWLPVLGISAALSFVFWANSTRPQLEWYEHPQLSRQQEAGAQVQVGADDKSKLQVVALASRPVATEPSLSVEPAPAQRPSEPETATTVVVSAPASAPAATSQDNAIAEAVASLTLDPEAVKRGKRGYMSCIACHGKTGSGVKGVGKDLLHSEFVARSSDEDLLAFIKTGRSSDDPANTTGIAMPPKGGNPALKDNQIQDIVTYIRSLQQAAYTNANATP